MGVGVPLGFQAYSNIMLFMLEVLEAAKEVLQLAEASTYTSENTQDSM